MTIREALLAMGYREEKSGYWLKPIGYQLFSYHEGRGEWANWFKSATGEIGCWATNRFIDEKDKPYLDQIKSFECWTRTDMFVNGNSEFQLLAVDL